MNEATRHENENGKWHCPEGDKLWADLDTDAERIEFLKSGRAISTGIIAPSMVDEIVKIFQRAEKAEADTEAAEVTIERLTTLLRERGGDPSYPTQSELTDKISDLEPGGPALTFELGTGREIKPDKRDKARADLAEAQAVIEQVREVGRNFDCTNPEASKQALCAAFLTPAPATPEEKKAIRKAVINNARSGQAPSCCAAPAPATDHAATMTPAKKARQLCEWPTDMLVPLVSILRAELETRDAPATD